MRQSFYRKKFRGYFVTNKKIISTNIENNFSEKKIGTVFFTDCRHGLGPSIRKTSSRRIFLPGILDAAVDREEVGGKLVGPEALDKQR